MIHTQAADAATMDLHKPQEQSLSYSAAGVDIDAGARLVERIMPMAKRTNRPGVLGNLGGFGGLFALPTERYRQPVLVSSTDGVGTKLKLAQFMACHDTIGIDLVAMCVNDVLVTGAEPLFFLDYYATGKLQVDEAAQVINGIATGCEQAGCALIGGETAEMPGIYAPDDYDLAGFAVGIVEKTAILGAHRVQVGDAIIGIASSGPHANGYSLIRKVLEVSCADLDQEFAGHTLGSILLTPTRIYVRPLLQLLAAVDIHTMVHITGGGITDNVPRVLPPNTQAAIDLTTWQRPAVFRWLQAAGNITEAEMLRTFNCGVGLMVILPTTATTAALQQLEALGEKAWYLGQVQPADVAIPMVKFCGSASGSPAINRIDSVC